MASLLSDPLFYICGRGPAPRLDSNIYYFTVTKSEVIWEKTWVTSSKPPRYYRPEELRMPHQDFWDDTRMKSDVRVVFGQRILEYSKALCQGQYDYLDRLSDSLLLQIINSLELEDVGQLAQTSHRFRKLCGSEEFWEQAVRRCCTTVSDEVASLALEVGWRSVFFTNKLQTEEQQASDPDTKTEESPDSPGLGRSQAHSAAQEKKFDLLSDLGGDIFAAPPTQTASSTNFANFAHFPSQSAPQGNSNTNFANFEAFGNTTVPSHLSTSAPSKSFPSGGGVPVPSLSSAVPAQSQTGSCTEDRYAALAELDNKLSSSVTTGSNVQGNIFGPVLGSSPAQNPPVLPSMQPGFGAVPSTNPFVAAAVAPEMTTNPFQTNGRAPAVASFGTGSMSMPAGFGNASSYCLLTSFSGNFQQQFPGQAPIPYAQPGAYHPQSNG